MKFNINKRAMQVAIAATGLTLLSGCGSSNPPPPPPAAAAGGLLGGGCVPIMTTNMIGFQATNMYLGNIQIGDTSVVAGNIPMGDSVTAAGPRGTVMVTAGNVMPPAPTQFGVPMQFQTQRVDGTSMTLSITSAQTPVTPGTPYSPYGYGGGGYQYPYPATGNVNGNGYIQISSTLQNALIQMAMTGNPYGGYASNGGFFGGPGTYPSAYPQQPYANAGQICVSGLAFSLQRTNPSFANWLYLGNVYFYLSGGMMNGQHGLSVYF